MKAQEPKGNYKAGLYQLSTGNDVTSVGEFDSPVDEYQAAFADRSSPFVSYYNFREGTVKKRVVTRGEFWDMAKSAATYINSLGLKKGDRMIHAFSGNSLYDLAFRLAEVLTGCVPVTINWQADDNEQLAYKAKVTNAKVMIYDSGFVDRLREIRERLLNMFFLNAEGIEGYQSPDEPVYASLDYRDERMVIFTSGTTGRPKGVSLSHRSYLANRLTFESYFGISQDSKLDVLLTNPLHHSNSSAISDWAMRRKGAIIHLLERYTSLYWKILVDAVQAKRDVIVAPLVSRHFDFLESLATESKLPIQESKLKEALEQTNILIGSAPVGPTTINRVLKFSKHLPHVRFGATETCLQVLGTPTTMPDDDIMKAFEAGWQHRYQGREVVGYYVGREHYPFTRVKVVKSIEPGTDDYLCPCEIGEPGYLITQGPNIMSYYVGDYASTKSVFKQGWYTGLRDVVFALTNPTDGQTDYYWASRESDLLIRGGANYAYDQIAAELQRFVAEHYQIDPNEFQLAVVGLRLGSEHEDSCCVTIELGEEASSIRSWLEESFLEDARQRVSKSTRPDYVRFAPIPRSFKGAVLYPQLKEHFREWLEHNR